MATIDITRSHNIGKDAARAKAEELAKSMEAKLGLTWGWAGDVIRFEAPSGAAKGTKGDVSVTESAVRVTVDLPFMLRMMKTSIETRIEEKLRELL
jgi:putative polyhydroxyalkanoate system protein